MFDKRILGLPGARRALGVLFPQSLVEALLAVVQALCLAWALAGLWKAAGAGSVELQRLAPFVAGFAACYIARQVVTVMRQRYMRALSARCTNGLLERLMRTLYAQGPRHVQRFGSGNVTAAAVEGADRVKSYIELSLPKSADLMAVPVVIAIALLALDWISGIIAIIMLPCIMFFMRLLGINSRQAAAAQHDEYERLTNHFADILRGFPTIKMFGRARAFDDQVYSRSEALRSATVKTLRTVTLSSLVLDLFRTFALAAIAIMLGFRLMDGSIALFNALAALILVPEYFAPIRRFSADYHATLEGKNQLKALLSMVEGPQEGAETAGHEGAADADATDADVTDTDAGAAASSAADADGADAVPGSTATAAAAATGAGVAAATSAVAGLALAEPLAAWSEASTLCVKGLNRTFEDGSRGLRDATFEVHGIKKVGIVGASGAGKSTLLSLLAGFDRPDGEGMPFGLDGRPLHSLDVPGWLRQVTFIPQEPHLFSASLRDNIAFYCPDATDAQVAAAVAAAGLESTVAALPDGLDTLVGQGGRALSGGQAQRVALARAFLDSSRRVWLFDEPTAHLDVETEFELKRNMLELMEGHLVFFATHRLHWMRDMDLLVVLEGSTVAEVGTYDELANASGAFSRLSARLQEGYGA